MGKVIFEDIRKEIEDLRQKIEVLELRLADAERASCNAGLEAGEAFTEPVTLSIDLGDADMVVSPGVSGPETASEPAPEPYKTPAREPVPEPAREPAPEPVEELTEVQSLPELNYKWMKDECGKKISNVISGISLNDRMSIINVLCGENPVAFQNLIAEVNACGSFAEAVDKVIKTYPKWDLGSAPVYSFMMAVRRKFC